MINFTILGVVFSLTTFLWLVLAKKKWQVFITSHEDEIPLWVRNEQVVQQIVEKCRYFHQTRSRLKWLFNWFPVLVTVCLIFQFVPAYLLYNYKIVPRDSSMPEPYGQVYINFLCDLVSFTPTLFLLWVHKRDPESTVCECRRVYHHIFEGSSNPTSQQELPLQNTRDRSSERQLRDKNRPGPGVRDQKSASARHRKKASKS